MTVRKKREPMSEGEKNIIASLIEEYDIQTAEDIQLLIILLFGVMISAISENPSL